MECYTYLRNIQDLLSDWKTPYERRFGQPFKGPIFPFGSLVEYYLFLRKTCQEYINLERKSYLNYSFDTLCTRCEFGRVTYWLQTSRSWKRWTHQKSTLKDSMQRKQYFPKENGQFTFPLADGRIKLSGGDQELRTSTLIRDHPIRGESQRDFLGESEGSLPPPQDSLSDAGEAIHYLWSKSGNFIYRHHVEPRVKLYSPRRIIPYSTEIH